MKMRNRETLKTKNSFTRTELLDRWRLIQEEQDDDDLSPSKLQQILRAKEQWFLDAFQFLIDLPVEDHIWCGCSEIMGPLLETFHGYFNDKRIDSPLKLIWIRVSQEMEHCAQCICQHHQAQEAFGAEYESDTIDPLLGVLHCLDEERVTKHLKEINGRLQHNEYDPERHGTEVISIMFEVLTYPTLLDDQSLVNEFQFFIEEIEKSHDVNFAGSQQYPGVYALLFFKTGRARAIGLRLAGSMGKLRRASDLEPLQPLLQKYIGFLETEVSPSTLETSRPRVQLERTTVWLGIKTLLGFLAAPAFEDGILEKYPNFLSIILNHVSDDTLESSYAITCLKASFEILGCKLWWRTTLSPSVMRNTLLGQCFHTRNEKSHKDIFDLFLPFLQSLEALQDGEHEKQRRHFLYFLLHQVTQSSNFSILTRKNACKIALLIIHRGYKIDPPCPPFECAHMWGPTLVSSLKDSSLHSSLRQPAFDLMQTIIISDASALAFSKLKHHSSTNIDSTSANYFDDEDELPFLHAVEEETSCWNEFNMQSKLASRECMEWACIPMLWHDALIEVGPSMLPVSFSKAILWALSHTTMTHSNSSVELSLPLGDWLSSYAGEISSSFGWEAPGGCDDGGDGKKSRNSVLASTMCITLIDTFKRFAAGFITTMEKHELHKQWTWEPKMAESLIILLVDPNDTIRQAGKVLLDHVSKTQDLTSQLKFLCAGASSLSAIYVGLRCALKQVQVDSISANFHYFHHLFFIVSKLIKDVVKSHQKIPVILLEDTKCGKFSSEGGFLRQPFSENLVGNSECSAVVVDMKSWEKFSCLLSSIMWPFMVNCLPVGKDLIESKNCQMTFVRLLDSLPFVFERLCSPTSKLLGSFLPLVSHISNFKWLCDLMDWGKSSLVVIRRRWKQCMLSLMDLFKGSCSSSSQCTISVIEAILQRDTFTVEHLKEEILRLTISLSSKDSCTLGKSINETSPFGVKLSTTDTCPSGRHVYAESTIPVQKLRDPEVVILSDDETANVASPKLLDSSFNKSSCIVDKVSPPVASKGLFSDGQEESSFKKSSCVVHEISPSVSGKGLFSDCQMDSFSTSLPKDILEPFPSRIFFEEEQKDDVLDNNRMLSEDESYVGGNMASRAHLRGNSLNNARDPYTSGPPVKSHSSARAITSRTCKDDLALDKENAVIREIVCSEKDDPLERALDNFKRSQSILTKPIASAPKRKVVQLLMPTNSKSGFHNRLGAGLRRLKPPRLDDWYRPILELDYFAIVGLSSGNDNNNKTTTNLKEVPLYFESMEHYVQIFRPLVLEEFKAQLHNSYLETSSEDISCGSLCILSVERTDDFHLVRGRPDDAESASSKGCSENDLVLLTREPLKKSVQDVHVLGKVERREKSNKSRSVVLVIRFYLPNVSSRLNKVMRLLIERSKWYVNRIMSITPQVREFQALSSLHDIPILPIILNPVGRSLGCNEYRKMELDKLSRPLQDKLKSSFNDSQLQAVSVAIGAQTSRKIFELCLVQGPPGTGKTRTIVATVSAVLALHSTHENHSSKFKYINSRASSVASNNPRTVTSQTAAVARAWQDAAFAKQLIKDTEEDSSGPTDRTARARVLICAQSNAAVDELVSRISEGLYGNDAKVYKPYLVRVGNAKTVHPNSQPFFIDRLVEQRLAEEMIKNDETKNDTSMESSSLLRARLEKLVDSIRVYESKRAKLDSGDLNLKIAPDDGASKEEDVQEMSAAAIGAKLSILYGQKKVLCAELASAQTREKKISEENWSLRNKIRKSILMEAEIVVTTLSGCGGDLYGVCAESASSNKCGRFSEQCLFDVVVIDEAAQALEPATLIPLQLLKSNATRCIMVGDPKQLPATVLSNVASKFLYECSMFERLQRAGYPVIMLTEQYRMHPEISRFPSLHFYEKKLRNGAKMESKSATFHENAYLGPYMFYDIIDGCEHHGKNSASLSLYNEAEVEAAVGILKLLKKRYPSEFTSGRIGIITPYKSQLSLLRSRFSSAFGAHVASEMEFNTVDGFQGREVDILVLSTVRASETTNSSSLGFVADVRRMNVALTRAKFSLWVVGNARTLQRNLHWAALIQNAKERNLFISVSRPYDSIFKNALSLSRENSYLGGCKQGENVKDGNSGVQHSRKNVKKVHEVKSSHKYVYPKESDTSVSNNFPLAEVPMRGHSKDREMTTGRSLPNCESESSRSERHDGQWRSSINALQRDRKCSAAGTKIVQVDVQSESDSVSKESIVKAKEAKISSVHETSSRCQSRKSHMHTSAEGNRKQSGANSHKLPNVEGSDNGLKAKEERKRRFSEHGLSNRWGRSPSTLPSARGSQQEARLSSVHETSNASLCNKAHETSNGSRWDKASMQSSGEGNNIQCKANNHKLSNIEDSGNGFKQKVKEKRRFSEHSTSNRLGRHPATLPSAGGSQVNQSIDCKISKPGDKPKDILATRKRQRDDVDALLSSALISSKKLEISSSSGSVNRMPTTAPARGISKPSSAGRNPLP